jgi:hypothetical protein
MAKALGKLPGERKRPRVAQCARLFAAAHNNFEKAIGLVN